jgi:hypothetical protein
LTFFDDINLRIAALKDIEDHKVRYGKFKQTFLSNQIKDFLINREEERLYSDNGSQSNINKEYIMSKRLRQSLVDPTSSNL